MLIINERGWLRDILEEKEVRFIIFLLYSLAENWNMSPAQVYQILFTTGILDEYIIPCYDVLHTLGKECLVEDITEFVNEKRRELDTIDLERYHQIYKEISVLQPDDTLQLVLESETEEEKCFYELVADFLLQKEQKKVIEKKLF